MDNFTPYSAIAGGLLIGIAAALLWVSNGRIAGISGIVGGLCARRFASQHGRRRFEQLCQRLRVPARFHFGSNFHAPDFRSFTLASRVRSVNEPYEVEAANSSPPTIQAAASSWRCARN